MNRLYESKFDSLLSENWGCNSIYDPLIIPALYSRIRLEPVSEITACQCHLVGKQLWEIFPQAGQEKR